MNPSDKKGMFLYIALTGPRHLREISSTSSMLTNSSRQESLDQPNHNSRSISHSPNSRKPATPSNTGELKWPNKAILDARYLPIPASSAPVERVFTLQARSSDQACIAVGQTLRGTDVYDVHHE